MFQLFCSYARKNFFPLKFIRTYELFLMHLCITSNLRLDYFAFKRVLLSSVPLSSNERMNSSLTIPTLSSFKCMNLFSYVSVAQFIRTYELLIFPL